MLIGPRTLRLCSTCLSRQSGRIARSTGSSSRLVSTSSARRLESRIPEPQTSTSSSSLVLEHPPVSTQYMNQSRSSSSSTSLSDGGVGRNGSGFGLIGEELQEEMEWEPREERRSPAAVFGSKRIGLEMIPETLEERIQAEISGPLNLPLPPFLSPPPVHPPTFV